MDNATFHKRLDTRELIKDSGYTVLWLPPYSPDLNPIEQTWAWIKRKRKELKLNCIDQLFFFFFGSVTVSRIFDHASLVASH